MGCCVCCSSPPPHKEHAPEPGIKLHRRCHDVFFLIAFVAFWVGMFYVASQAVQGGDPERLVYGVGYDGNICNSNNTRLAKTYPQYARDMRGKKYLYMLPGTDGSSFLGICVDKCPTETYLHPTTVDEILCPYNVTPSMDAVGIYGPCWGKYATENLIHRCIPFIDSDLESNITAGVIKAFNVDQAKNISIKLIGDVIRAWRWIAIAGAIALLLSFIWLLLLRLFAGVMVWTTIVGVIAVIAIFAYEVYHARTNLTSFYEGVPVYARLISEEDTIKILEGVWYLLVIVDAVIILVVLCMAHRVAIAIGVIKEASKAMLRIPTILLVPVGVGFAMIPFGVYWIYIAAYLGSGGSPEYDANGDFKGYTNDHKLTYMMLYHLFGGYWTLNFLHAIVECTIAGAIGSWYWVHDKHNVPNFPVARSLYNIFRYHLGSLLFGALILAIVQFIRFLLHQFEKATKDKQTAMSKFFFKCVQCILACFERFIRFLNKNAYIMIAIYGYSFCEGARRGFSLITANILRVTALNCVSGFLIFLGKLFVSMLTTLAAFMYLSRIQDTRVSDYMLPIIVIAILAYAISAAFFEVFDMGIDTVLLCFCEDCDRNDGSAEKPYFMSNSLRSHVDREHTCCFCMCC